MINQSVFRHVAIFLASVSGVLGVDYCTLFLYCKDGYYCCDNNTACCPTSLAAGVLIAIVIGCILFVSCVVGVICCACKNHNQPIQIIQPAPQTGGVAFVASGQQPMYIQQPGQPMYGQPSYGQQPQYGAQPATQQQYGGEIAGASQPGVPPLPSTYGKQ